MQSTRVKLLFSVAKLSLSALFLLPAACSAAAEETTASPESGVEDFLGRWDVTIESPEGNYPSWFEITRRQDQLEGRFVGRFGSARPIKALQISGGLLKFSLPVQYESHASDLNFEGGLSNGNIEGTTNAPDGSRLHFTARRAPSLSRSGEPRWGEPIQLFNRQDLAGWKPRQADAENRWQAKDGALDNTAKGSDLVTEGKYMDFKLHLEFKYPKGSNSGVYLRGRYEVQVEDSFGKQPDSLYLGGVYGFLTPSRNAARPAGQWQSCDITLYGRNITVVLNGETIIENQEIPGITGGALDSHEGEPGPILLQGDHGPVTYRNIVLTPAL